MLKIDPRRPEAPVVWAVHTNFRVDDGVWTTPVVGREVVFWTSKPGTIYAIDGASGAVLSTPRVPGPVLSSPVLVDGVLLQGDATGVLHAFDVADPRAAPVELWQLDIGANIESTPAVWNGRIYVGTRAGYFVCVGSVTRAGRGDDHPPDCPPRPHHLARPVPRRPATVDRGSRRVV